MSEGGCPHCPGPPHKMSCESPGRVVPPAVEAATEVLTVTSDVPGMGGEGGVMTWSNEPPPGYAEWSAWNEAGRSARLGGEDPPSPPGRFQDLELLLVSIGGDRPELMDVDDLSSINWNPEADRWHPIPKGWAQ